MKWIIHKQDENLRYSKVTYTDAMTEWNQWSGYSSLAAEHDTTATDRTEPIPIASHGLVEFISHLFLAHEVSQTIGRNSCVYRPPPPSQPLHIKCNSSDQYERYARRQTARLEFSKSSDVFLA